MITEEFTPEQAATVERFEAGQAAAESLRERIVTTLIPFMPPISFSLRRAMACDAADAALAVIRGEAS